MISMVQNLHIGNALRLFIEPIAGAARWRVLRKASDTFTDQDDTSALVAYEGDDKVFIDSESLTNEVMAFYRPFYQDADGDWTAGATVSATPTADYADYSTDAMSLLRERLEAGLLVECQRGNFRPEEGYIAVFTAPPSLERDLRLPLVTLHLDGEDPLERAIGECISGDEFDQVGFNWNESQGWLAGVNITVIGWSLNSDERIELRKALRRIVIGNFEVFNDKGLDQINLSLSDVDAVNGEYPAPLYQVMGNFSCTAPIRVGGPVSAINSVTVRSIEIGNQQISP